MIGNQGVTNAKTLAFGLAEEMRAFDSLPVELREKLRNAPFKFCAMQVRSYLQRGRTPKDVIAMIDRTCARIIKEAELLTS